MFKIDLSVFLSRNLDNGQIILSETVWTKLYEKLDQRKFFKKKSFGLPDKTGKLGKVAGAARCRNLQLL